jgi:hypothetical protein
VGCCDERLDLIKGEKFRNDLSYYQLLKDSIKLIKAFKRNFTNSAGINSLSELEVKMLTTQVY